MTLKKLGSTMDLGESLTNHYVVDLITACVTPNNVPGSPRRNLEATAKDSRIPFVRREFSSLLCGSDKVTIIDVDRPRVSLAGEAREQSCRRWTIGKFLNDSGIFVEKVCCKKTNRHYCLDPGQDAHPSKRGVTSLRDTCCVSHKKRRL